MKPILVMIHGLRGTHNGLLPMAERLADDFRVLTPDLPGSGDAAELVDKSLDGYTEWLHEYCTGLPEKPFILGHSMGSIIVSRYVEKYPDDVREKVVLLSPILRTRSGERLGQGMYYVLRGVLAPFPESLQKRILASDALSYAVSHYLTYDKTKQKQIDEMHYQYGKRFSSAASLVADVKISLQATAVVPEGKKVMMIVGSADKLAKPRVVRTTGATTGAEYREVDAVGHFLNYEKPAETAEMVREFLK